LGPNGIITSFSGGSSGVQAVSAQTFLDTGNNYFGISGPTHSTSLTSNSSSFGLGASQAFNLVGTYALTQVLTITFGSGGDVSLDDSTIIAPEPSSMAIGGLGALRMIGYGLRGRKARDA
jgi:hypothetical protein